VQDSIKYSDHFPYERTMNDTDTDQLVDQYLALFRKNQDLDKAVRTKFSTCQVFNLCTRIVR
jgi:hypothetical protein